MTSWLRRDIFKWLWHDMMEMTSWLCHDIMASIWRFDMLLSWDNENNIMTSTWHRVFDMTFWHDMMEISSWLQHDIIPWLRHDILTWFWHDIMEIRLWLRCDVICSEWCLDLWHNEKCWWWHLYIFPRRWKRSLHDRWPTCRTSTLVPWPSRVVNIKQAPCSWRSGDQRVVLHIQAISNLYSGVQFKNAFVKYLSAACENRMNFMFRRLFLGFLLSGFCVFS